MYIYSLLFSGMKNVKCTSTSLIWSVYICKLQYMSIIQYQLYIRCKVMYILIIYRRSCCYPGYGVSSI